MTGWREDEERQLARLRARAASRRARLDRGRPPEGVEGDDVAVPGGQRMRGVPPPTDLDSAVAQLLRREGWGHRLAAAGVHRAWPEVVGEALAAHCRPVAIRGDVLVVEASSSAWATELRYMSRDLVRGVERVLDVRVTSVEVRVAGAADTRGRRERGRGPRA